MRSRSRIAAVIMACLVAPAFGQAVDEYQVKAAFLLNFANFIEWPPGTFTSAQDSFKVCVLGRNPFGSAFEALANRKTADGRKFEIRQIGGARQAAGCQIVFVSSAERLRYRAISEDLRGNVLLVGETSDFVSQGGTIGLLLNDSRIRMAIDAEGAKARNLRISSHLLSLAQNGK